MANVLVLSLVLVVIAAGGNAGMAGAQSTPPSSSSCTTSLATLAPCLTFLQGGQNNTTPTPGCCTGLASVVNTSAACLCQLLTTTNNTLGIPINQTRALALPGACKITTPSPSQCKSPAASSPPALAPSSPTLAVSNPTATAKSPTAVTGGAISPTTRPITGGAISPSTKEGPTASALANAGSMMGVSMWIHVMGIVGSLTYIISASSI